MDTTERLTVCADELVNRLNRKSKTSSRLKKEIQLRRQEADDLRTKLDKLSKELKEATPYIIQFNELNAKYGQLVIENTNLKEVNMKLTEELATEKKSIGPNQKALENQIVLENKTKSKLQSLKVLNDKKNIHIAELTNEINGQLTDEKKKKFKYEFKKLQKQAENHVEQYKQAINKELISKIRHLEKRRQAENNKDVPQRTIIAINGYIIELTSQINDLLDTYSEIWRKVINLDQLSNMQEEDMSRKLQSQDLMDINLDLDMEIRTYRNLLEGEEKRLGIIPNTSVVHSIGEKKRKLIQQDTFSNAIVNIETNKWCLNGLFDKNFNNGPKADPQTREEKF